MAPWRRIGCTHCCVWPPCESIGFSTRIEGSRLSDRDVERLLSNLQIQRFSTRDEQEVAGYAKVMEMVFTFWQDIALTENHNP